MDKLPLTEVETTTRQARGALMKVDRHPTTGQFVKKKSLPYRPKTYLESNPPGSRQSQ